MSAKFPRGGAGPFLAQSLQSVTKLSETRQCFSTLKTSTLPTEPLSPPLVIIMIQFHYQYELFVLIK